MERRKIDHQVHNYVTVNCTLEIHRLNNVWHQKSEHKDKVKTSIGQLNTNWCLYILVYNMKENAGIYII